MNDDDIISMGGFPFGFTYDIATLDTRRQDSAAGAYVMAGPIELHASLPILTRWSFEAPQGLRIFLRRDAADAAPILAAARASGDIAVVGARWTDLLQGRPGPSARYRIDATLPDVRAESSGRPWRADKITIALTLPAEPAAGADPLAEAGRVTLSAFAIRLPETVPALGQTIDRLELSGLLHGAVPALPDIKAALGRWRDAGGTLDITGFDLAWQDVNASGNGTLAFDQAMQPMGAFSMAISGYGTILDALVASGRLKARDAGYARIALDLLARAGDPVHHNTLRAPVTAQDSALYIGPLKLGVIPPLPWPVPQ